MTRTGNARLAGAAYLFYIAVAFPSMLLMDRATSGEGIAAKVATLTQHAGEMRLIAVLTLLSTLSALVLAVTLYALTRDEDPDLAMLGLTCRVTEGVTGAVSIPTNLGLLRMVTATGPNALDAAATQAVVAFVLNQPWLVGATFFAVGSTLFCWLLLRGRMIPTPLAWLGVIASILVVVCLPMQIGGVLEGPITQLMWLPMAAFEICVGVWWLIKGDTTPSTR